MASAPPAAAGPAGEPRAPPPVRALSRERPLPADPAVAAGRGDPQARLQCGDCERSIPALDSHGVARCRLCGSLARLQQ
eukprot:15202274-Alexandrium_andersonii.AAC.1